MTIPDLPLSANDTRELVRMALPAEEQGIDLQRLFGNERDVELEIGVGKGRFVLLAASSQPEKNFLGVEYARRYLEHAVDRVGKRGLENVRLTHAEAVEFIDSRLEQGSIAAAHVYFPDPWPKKRHHKRRLFRSAGLDALARVLRPGAPLRVATDHDDYASLIEEAVSAHAQFERIPPRPDLWDLPAMGDYTRLGVTNFEIKYRREGRSIHRFAWRREGAKH